MPTPAVGRNETYHHANFSKLVYPKQRYWDFFYFQMAATAIFYFYNHQIFWLTGCRGSRLMSMSNFGKIGQLVAKILRIFNFSKWRPPPSWICKFVKFDWQTVSGRPRHIVLNVVKISCLVVETLQFFEFSKCYHRHLGFLKQRKFIGYWGGEGRDASACQTSKLVNRLRRYWDFSIFQDGGRRRLGLSNSVWFLRYACWQAITIILWLQLGSRVDLVSLR